MTPSSGRQRSRGRRIAAVGTVIVLALVGGSLAAYQVLGSRQTESGSTSTAAAPTPRFVDEASSAGLTHRYAGDTDYFVGGGVAAFDCDADGLPGPVSRRRRGTGGAVSQRQPGRRGAPVRARSQTRRPTSTAVTGAYPLDIDGDGITDLVVLRRRRERRSCAGSATAGSSAPNERWAFDGGDGWTDGIQRDMGGPATRCRRSRSATTSMLDADGEWTASAPTNELIRPAAGGAAYARRDRADARATARCRCCSATGTAPGRRDLRVTQRPPLLRRRSGGRSSSGGSSPGEPPRLYTAGRRLADAPDLGHGHRQPGPHGRRLPGGLPDQPGRQQAPDARRRPGAADVQGHRAAPRGDRATAVHRRRPAAVDRVAPRVPGRQQRRLHGPVRRQGQRRGRARLRREGPEQPAARAARRHVRARAPSEAGIVSFERGRGAALADLNLDGLLDLVEVDRRENVQLWRNVGGGTADAPAPMGHWLGLRLDQRRGRTATPSARGSRSGSATGDRSAR